MINKSSQQQAEAIAQDPYIRHLIDELKQMAESYANPVKPQEPTDLGKYIVKDINLNRLNHIRGKLLNRIKRKYPLLTIQKTKYAKG